MRESRQEEGPPLFLFSQDKAGMAEERWTLKKLRGKKKRGATSLETRNRENQQKCKKGTSLRRERCAEERQGQRSTHIATQDWWERMGALKPRKRGAGGCSGAKRKERKQPVQGPHWGSNKRRKGVKESIERGEPKRRWEKKGGNCHAKSVQPGGGRWIGGAGSPEENNGTEHDDRKGKKKKKKGNPAKEPNGNIVSKEKAVGRALRGVVNNKPTKQ